MDAISLLAIRRNAAASVPYIEIRIDFVGNGRCSVPGRIMKPERWQDIQNLYHGAVEREPSERSLFLDKPCAGDEALRAEVESLLAHHQQAGSFIETPALEEAQRLLEDHPRTMVVSLKDLRRE